MIGQLLRTASKRIETGLLVLLASILLAAMTLPLPAAAHNIDGCGNKKVTYELEPDAHLHSKAIFEHTTRVYSYAAISLWWATYCGASSGDHPRMVDMYIATYVDKLVGGSYSQCHSDIPGWKGNTSDPYVNELSETTIRSSCNWTSSGNPVRVRNLSKFQESNNTVHSVWATTGSHSG